MSEWSVRPCQRNYAWAGNLVTAKKESEISFVLGVFRHFLTSKSSSLWTEWERTDRDRRRVEFKLLLSIFFVPEFRVRDGEYISVEEIWIGSAGKSLTTDSSAGNCIGSGENWTGQKVRNSLRVFFFQSEKKIPYMQWKCIFFAHHSEILPLSHFSAGQGRIASAKKI